MSEFSTAQNILLSLLGRNLFSASYTPPPDTKWAEVIKEGKAQAVLLIAFNTHKELNLAQEIREPLQKELQHLTMNNLVCMKQHAYIHSLLSKNGIDYCMLKGAVSASYYPEPLIRCMGDVDFYVHPNDIERAMAVFMREGFVRTDKNHVHHIALAKDNFHCEMHFDPIATPYGDVGEIYRQYWADIITGSHVVADGVTQYTAPTAFLHGLMSLAHVQGHLVSEGIGLRHLCDWAVFANSFSEEEFVSMFEERLKRVGLWRFACLLSLAASEYMGMPYKNWMGKDVSTATELISDILSGGNFGRKDRQRAYEGLFISNHGKNSVKTNRLLQVVKSLNYMVRSNWKIAEKCPLLYPVGWVFFSVRYVFRLLTGKRKLDIVDTYKQSGVRKDFYKKLKLFEPE